MLSRELHSSAELVAVVTDLKLPDGDGLQILAAARERSPLLPVVVMTPTETIEKRRQRGKAGSLRLIAKPVRSG